MYFQYGIHRHASATRDCNANNRLPPPKPIAPPMAA